MLTHTTDWMTIPGGIERRATITAAIPFDLVEAVSHYVEVTKIGMTLDQKIARGIHLHRAFAARYEHEYRRVA